MKKILYISQGWWFFILLSIVVSTQPILDPDLGWHIATGRWIASNQSIPRSDLFSFSAPDHEYIAHSWLQDVLIACLESNLGMWGIQVWYSLIFILISLVLARIVLAQTKSKHSLFLLLPLLMYMITFIGLRTHLITVLGLSLISWLFVQMDKNPNILKSVFLLLSLFFLVWTQMHAGVVIGLGFFLFWIVVCVLNPATRRFCVSKSKHIVWLVGGLSLITLLNPYGWHLYDFVQHVGPQQVSAQFNQDWVPLLSSDLTNDTVVLRLGLVFLACLVIVKSKNLSMRLLVGMYLALSLWSIRLVIPLFVVLIPELVIVIHRTFFTRSSAKINAYLPVVIAGVVLGLSLRSVNLTICANQSESCYANLGEYPTETLTRLQQISSPIRILNYYDWGGYLTWKLPQHQIFIDGRMDNYVVEDRVLMMDFVAIETAADNWQDIVANYQPDAILMPKASPITLGLKSAPGWYQISTDQQAELFIPDLKK